MLLLIIVIVIIALAIRAIVSIIARFFSEVNTFFHKISKSYPHPIVVMVEKLGLYSQALALYQKTSLCKVLMLRYSKTLMLRPQRANFFRLMLTPYVSPNRLCFPCARAIGLWFSQSAFPLCLRHAFAFGELLPLLYQTFSRLSTTSPKIAFSAFERASSSRVFSCFIGAVFSFFAWAFIKSQ